MEVLKLVRKRDAAKTVLRSQTGRKAAAKAAKGGFRLSRSSSGRSDDGSGSRGGLLGRGVAKAGKGAGKAGTKSLAKAGRGAGKYAARRGRKQVESAAKRGRREVRIAEKNLDSGRSFGSRLLKFGLLVATGLAIGALAGRLLGSGGSSSSSSITDTLDPREGSEGPDSPQRAQSDPSSGPLIGTDHDSARVEGVTEDRPEVEARIRTNIGEDERTRDMPRVNVEVNGGVAELRGTAPSDDAKEAAGEIAAEVEGVQEVRNLIEVSSEDSEDSEEE